MRGRITKRLVDAMKPGNGIVWDTTLTGFGVRMRPNGRATYLVKFGAGRRGRSRWLTIGKHGGPWADHDGRGCALTSELARREAVRLLGEKARGRDPAQARDRIRALPTLEEFAARYLSEHAEIHKKARTVGEDRANLRRSILPALGRNRIDLVTRADVARFHLSRRKTPTNANRCLALLSHMFVMAERWGLLPEGRNPCRHVERFRETKRKRFLSEAEIGRLAVALKEVEQKNPFAVAAIRLLLFTGARRSEILTLKWTDVHIGRGVLELADSKSGAKTIHLNAPALDVLAGLPRIGSNPWVLPGWRTGTHLADLSRPWTTVRKKAQIEDVRLHDLRHSFASVAVSGGASLPLIGGLLGHVTPETTQRYAHVGDNPLKAVAERTGEAIAAAMRIGGRGEEDSQDLAG